MSDSELLDRVLKALACPWATSALERQRLMDELEKRLG